jgi:hypothetical protein
MRLHEEAAVRTGTGSNVDAHGAVAVGSSDLLGDVNHDGPGNEIVQGPSLPIRKQDDKLTPKPNGLGYLHWLIP